MRSRLGRIPVIVAVAVVVATLVAFVLPTRTILAQRHRVAVTSKDVRILEDQNEALSAEAARLRSKAEIERRARREFNMVYPGERVFRVLPGAGPTTTAP